MNQQVYTLRFITPLFSKGAYEDKPEFRAASIRGQLHWWFRALGGTPEMEREVFGSIKPVQASKVIVRTQELHQTSNNVDKIPTLPHKQGGQASPKICYKIGATFKLLVSYRRGGPSESARRHFERTLEMWLLIGSLGLRATRGGGCFNCEELHQKLGPNINIRIDELSNNSRITTAILPRIYTQAEEARKIITDTLSHAAFQSQCYPLGLVKQRDDPKNLPPRKTSPLRLRIIEQQKSFRIVAIWDKRIDVTGNSNANLNSAITILQHSRKPIGEELHAVRDRLMR